MSCCKPMLGVFILIFRARRAGLGPDSWLCQGNETTSNVFFVVEDDLIQTYPSNNNILGGVTRDIVLDLAKKNNFKILEKPLNINNLKYIKEAFLTSTTVGVIPIIQIDKMVISHSQPGKVSKKMMSLFNANSKKQMNTIDE